MRLLIVIVNYRSQKLAIDCLRSLEPEVVRLKDCRVDVVENASGEREELANAIESHGWGSWCSLIDLPSNRGFAAGNNAAIEPALNSRDAPDYVLLLNPDTVVGANAIELMVRYLDSNPKVGIVGSRLEWEDGTDQNAARRFPTVASEFESTIRLGVISRLFSHRVIAPRSPDCSTETDWVVGASMMIRREVFESIGLMDEKYFLYFEEVDFCLRAFRAGWKVWYLPESRIVHLVGRSTGVTSSGKKGRCPKYWFESRSRYFLKNHGRTTLWFANAAALIGLSLSRVRNLVFFRPNEDHERYLSDFARFSLSDFGSKQEA